LDDILRLLKLLYAIACNPDEIEDGKPLEFEIALSEFHSKKLSNKMLQQIQDPLVLTSHALPEWFEILAVNCKSLFPFSTRRQFFCATTFGISRSIVWLQGLKDGNTDVTRPAAARRGEDASEYRLGRLKHERIKVPRNDQLLDYAINAMRSHGPRKSVMEVEFVDEEGTGLGPTLEFYALVAAELQRRDLGLWVCDDLHDVTADDRELDLGQGAKPIGYYVRRSSGLFPAPLPPHSSEFERHIKLFRFLGTFLARCLQDNRIVDLPLSGSFFKMMVTSPTDTRQNAKLRLSSDGSSLTGSPSPLDKNNQLQLSFSPVDENEDQLSREKTEEDVIAMENPLNQVMTASMDGSDQRPHMRGWFTGVLDGDDFMEINPNRAQFMRELRRLVAERDAILTDESLSKDDKEQRISSLRLQPLGQNIQPVKVEDLCLDFQFNPSSKSYGYSSYALKPGGEEIELTLENAGEYIDLVTDYCMNSGIVRQMDAFRDGFNVVFPMERLLMFTAEELCLILCGERVPTWTRDELLLYTEPKYGYNRESRGYQLFLDVLSDMDAAGRKAFLQFATGCSSLPPGGLANLHPRLTVVRKDREHPGTLPSVNTCVHYLKLPEYDSADELKEKLMAATLEKGFHLN
jgi:E3 ubiquitin-protein ligase HECTD1